MIVTKEKRVKEVAAKSMKSKKISLHFCVNITSIITVILSILLLSIIIQCPTHTDLVELLELVFGKRAVCVRLFGLVVFAPLDDYPLKKLWILGPRFWKSPMGLYKLDQLIVCLLPFHFIKI